MDVKYQKPDMTNRQSAEFHSVSKTFDECAKICADVRDQDALGGNDSYMEGRRMGATVCMNAIKNLQSKVSKPDQQKGFHTVTLAREFDACGECRLEIGGPDKYRVLSDDEILIVSMALKKCEPEMRAHVFVERYADGGEICADCRHSDQSGPGYGHTCKVIVGGDEKRPLNPTDCPALPEELYPEPA